MTYMWAQLKLLSTEPRNLVQHGILCNCVGMLAGGLRCFRVYGIGVVLKIVTKSHS